MAGFRLGRADCGRLRALLVLLALFGATRGSPVRAAEEMGAPNADPVPERVQTIVDFPLTEEEREFLRVLTDPEPTRSGVWPMLRDQSTGSIRLEYRVMMLMSGGALNSPPQDPAFAHYLALHKRGQEYRESEVSRIVESVESRMKAIPQLQRQWQMDRARASLEAILKKRGSQERPIPFVQADRLAKERTQQVFGQDDSPERNAFYKRALARTEQETQISPRGANKDVWSISLTPAERDEFATALQKQFQDSSALLFRNALLEYSISQRGSLSHILVGDQPLTLELLKQSEIQSVAVPDYNGTTRYRYELALPNGEKAPLVYKSGFGMPHGTEICPGEVMDNYPLESRPLSPSDTVFQHVLQEKSCGFSNAAEDMRYNSKDLTIRPLELLESGFDDALPGEEWLRIEARSQLLLSSYSKKRVSINNHLIYWGGIAQDPAYWDQRDRLTREKKLPLAQTKSVASRQSNVTPLGKVAKADLPPPTQRLELSDAVGNFAESHLDQTPQFKVSRSPDPVFFHLAGVSAPDLSQARSRVWQPSSPLTAKVRVQSISPLELSLGGRLAIPTPTGKELQSLRIGSIESRKRFVLGRDYQVLFDQDDGGYWVQFAQNVRPERVSFNAQFQTPAPSASSRRKPPSLARGEVLSLAQELRAAQLPQSAQALEALASKSKTISVSRIARGFADSAVYTHVPERDLPLEGASGPLKDASRYIDADGDLAVQCSGGNSIYCQLMSRARERNPKLWRTVLNKGFQVAAGQTVVLAKNAHAISVHIGPGDAREYWNSRYSTDATPSQIKGSVPASLEDIPLAVRERMEMRAEQELRAQAEKRAQDLRQSYRLQRDAWRVRLGERRTALQKALLESSKFFSELKNPGSWDASLPHARVPRLLAAAAAIEDGTLSPSEATRVLSDLVPDLREPLTSLGPEPTRGGIFDKIDQWSREVGLPELERAAAARLNTREAPLRFPSYSDTRFRTAMQEALRAFGGAPLDCAPGTLGAALKSLDGGSMIQVESR